MLFIKVKSHRAEPLNEAADTLCYTMGAAVHGIKAADTLCCTLGAAVHGINCHKALQHAGARWVLPSDLGQQATDSSVSESSWHVPMQ